MNYSTMSTKKPQTFKIGDRVAERPKATAIPNLSPEVNAKIAPYRQQRFGVVVGLFTKKSATRTRRVIEHKFVRVLWDGAKTPSEHAQMRICHEDALEKIRDEFCSSIGG